MSNLQKYTETLEDIESPTIINLKKIKARLEKNGGFVADVEEPHKKALTIQVYAISKTHDGELLDYEKAYVWNILSHLPNVDYVTEKDDGLFIVSFDQEAYPNGLEWE